VSAALGIVVALLLAAILAWALRHRRRRARRAADKASAAAATAAAGRPPLPLLGSGVQEPARYDPRWPSVRVACWGGGMRHGGVGIRASHLHKESSTGFPKDCPVPWPFNGFGASWGRGLWLLGGVCHQWAGGPGRRWPSLVRSGGRGRRGRRRGGVGRVRPVVRAARRPAGPSPPPPSDWGGGRKREEGGMGWQGSYSAGCVAAALFVSCPDAEPKAQRTGLPGDERVGLILKRGESPHPSADRPPARRSRMPPPRAPRTRTPPTTWTTPSVPHRIVPPR